MRTGMLTVMRDFCSVNREMLADDVMYVVCCIAMLPSYFQLPVLSWRLA